MTVSEHECAMVRPIIYSSCAMVRPFPFSKCREANRARLYMVTLLSLHLLLSYLSPSLLDRVSVQQYCRSLLELSPRESRARVLPLGTACEQECKHEAPPPRVKAYNLGGKRGARAFKPISDVICGQLQGSNVISTKLAGIRYCSHYVAFAASIQRY